MKALQFDFQWPRLAAAKLLGKFSPRGYLHPLGPLRLRETTLPALPNEEWVRIKVKHCGVCGSDLKQVFLEGAMDNPMASLLSFPHVLGHEMVGSIAEMGPRARATGRGISLEEGMEVAVYPWLSCVPRGLSPCSACAAGRTTQCRNFTEGAFAPGIHLGTCRDLPGGFSEYLVAHRTMCFPIPSGLSSEVATLADPFAVSMHAFLKAPPGPDDTVMVIGCGTLGLLLIQMLRTFSPKATILACDVHPHIEPLARSLGADQVFFERGAALIDAIGEKLGIPRKHGLAGLPWMLDGVDRIYDTVGAAQTLEVGVRIAKPQAALVLVGVAEPARFEWTPLYFKEINMLGSSGYDQEVFEGTPQHAFDLFFRLVAEGRIDPSFILTHHFSLDAYREAFLTAHDKRASHAVKVLVSPFAAPSDSSHSQRSRSREGASRGGNKSPHEP